MRGGLESAARWNAHFAREADRNREATIRALRTLTAEIQARFAPEQAREDGFWSVWYEWHKTVEAVRVPMGNLYYYAQGGGYGPSAVFEEFKRIVERRPIPEPRPEPATRGTHTKLTGKLARDFRAELAGPAPEQGALDLRKD
jgi:hypothetical protein